MNPTNDVKVDYQLVPAGHDRINVTWIVSIVRDVSRFSNLGVHCKMFGVQRINSPQE